MKRNKKIRLMQRKLFLLIFYNVWILQDRDDYALELAMADE